MGMSAGVNEILVEEISKSYGSKVVLNRFSCRIPYGKTISVMGKSGCGKTTLLSILTGRFRADSGAVRGIENLKLSMVFQEDRLCGHLSSVENVKLVCQKSVSLSDIVETLTALGLKESLHQPVSQLSGGMQRRVAIARALMADYDFLILDEAFKGLDAETRSSVISYTKEKIKGKTILMVTHDREEARLMEAEILYMGEA